MRVLLTGVTGQVGAALVNPLRCMGQVISADRRCLDLSRPDQIATTLDRLRPDVIVNPAAYTAVDVAEDQHELAFRINAEAPAAMAQWARKHDVPLVHFSTDYVFDGASLKPWQEEDIPSPLQVYGASKLAGEQAIRSAGCRALILRTSWVYASVGRNFLRTIARLALERSELTVVSDQIGAPTSARTIASAVVQLLRQDLHRKESGGCDCSIVNVSSTGKTSWHGFAEAIVAGLRARDVSVATQRVIPIASADYPTKAMRPLYSVLSHARLGQLGISMPSWEEGLAIELDELRGEFVDAMAARS